MTITQTWTRNEPNTICGESITQTIIYSSFEKAEIDDLEMKMPKGMTISSTDSNEKRADKLARLVKKRSVIG